MKDRRLQFPNLRMKPARLLWFSLFIFAATILVISIKGDGNERSAFSRAFQDQGDALDRSCSSTRNAYTITRAHRRLRGHSIKTFSSPSLISCGLQCVRNPRCVSTNFKVGTSNKGGECELNDHGVSSLTDERGLEHVQGVVYTQYPIESQCSSGPCQNNGTCVSRNEQNSYMCVCAAGYTGKNCETDIDECASNPCLHEETCEDKNNDYRCHCYTGFTGKNCGNVPHECRDGNYRNLNESSRRLNASGGNDCDYHLRGWYRFSGDAGTKMLSGIPGGTNRCGTDYPGYVIGDHPSLEKGQVARNVSFVGTGSECCLSIIVRNCVEFFVYKLKPVLFKCCNARYCSSD